jgi:DNA gyrase subunit A
VSTDGNGPDDPEGNGPEGNGPDGNGPDGNGPDGNGPDGNGPDGNGPDGNGPDGNGPDGNGPDGNGPDGNGPDGNGPDGNGPDGNGPDGNGPDGNGPDGNGPDGDGPDGDGPDGDGPDGDGPDGDGPDGDGPDGDGPDGDGPDGDGPDGDGPEGDGEIFVSLSIEDELKQSYLTYAMSVIVSRALPDVRDGLKPSQRRILVAMNDLSLGPNSSRVKCAKISGDTSGNYHPHGESVIYPTLVRMAQEWNMRHVLIDKQGNFGSVAGLPPAAMRYTEARLSAIASMMLDDINLDTVDYTPTYDEQRTEPTVLPARFPNLLVNGAQGIAVGMATSIPPHNLGEVCDATIMLLDEPETSLHELCQVVKGPDFPTGGTICGRSGILRGYHTGRSTVIVRAKVDIEVREKQRTRIVVREIPYQQYRDRVVERIAGLANEGRVKGIHEIRDESDLKEPVRLVIELKRDADPEVVLNQLYQFSSLQDTFSIILLALVDGKPRELSLKEILQEFIRHRVIVLRRRTQFLLVRARRRKHTIEGQLLALANIDEIIRIIRASRTQAEAKIGLMGVECPAAMMERALGESGFKIFQDERGESDTYSLTAVQSDAILRMTLGQLVNLEQERLSDEHGKILEQILEYLRILSDERNILALIREDMVEIRRRFADKRRTVISDEEVRHINLEDLIEEEMMVVAISHQGYIKRTSTSTYRAQRRGGKGLKGARTEEEDPIAHLFVANTHDYLLFFTNRGKVYWLKVYDIPQLSRESRGRAIANVLEMGKGESIQDCRAVRDFKLPDHCLTMATRSGLIKKTPLAAYSRPKKGGIIAIKLRDDDELVDVVVTKPGDEIVLSTAAGMAIRFSESDARSMGRNTSGVKGINLSKGDELVGMVVADTNASLLTICEKGYGKRTPFGPGAAATEEGGDEDDASSSSRYRTQRRGGKGLRDIKTTDRNGNAVVIVRVDDDDELLMMTARGKIQRVAAAEISVIGRNTQGVRIMSIDEGDTLAAVVRVPKEEEVDEDLVGPDGEELVVAVGDDVSDDDVSEDDDASDDDASDDDASDDDASDDDASDDDDAPETSEE